MKTLKVKSEDKELKNHLIKKGFPSLARLLVKSENKTPEEKSQDRECLGDKPKCKLCWDKGYSTFFNNCHNKPRIDKNYCTCELGKKIKLEDKIWGD